MLHVYCGNGKGKTTAAVGLAIRAAGCGMKVHFVQFLKGGETSELRILSEIPEVTVLRCERRYGFTFQLNDKEKADLTSRHNAMLSDVMNRMHGGQSDLVVLDEFFAAYNYRLLDRNLANRLVFGRPSRVEMVLTGRDPEEKFIEAADYVTQMQAIRHPYESGAAARLGIEY